NRAAAERTVFLAGNLCEDDALQFTTALAASGHPGVVLFHSTGTVKYARAFLQSFGAEQVIPVGSFSGEKNSPAKLYKAPVVREFGTVRDLQRALFSDAKRVIVAPADDRRLLLHAAALAGALKAPLLVAPEAQGKLEELKQLLADWKTCEILAVGAAAK